jgi:hypothetical protein
MNILVVLIIVLLLVGGGGYYGGWHTGFPGVTYGLGGGIVGIILLLVILRLLGLF